MCPYMQAKSASGKQPIFRLDNELRVSPLDHVASDTLQLFLMQVDENDLDRTCIMKLS